MPWSSSFKSRCSVTPTDSILWLDKSFHGVLYKSHRWSILPGVLMQLCLHVIPAIRWSAWFYAFTDFSQLEEWNGCLHNVKMNWESLQNSKIKPSRSGNCFSPSRKNAGHSKLNHSILYFCRPHLNGSLLHTSLIFQEN